MAVQRHEEITGWCYSVNMRPIVPMGTRLVLTGINHDVRCSLSMTVIVRTIEKSS